MSGIDQIRRATRNLQREHSDLAWWNSSFFFALVGIEIAVVLVEASILNRLGGLPWIAGFLLSLTCNLASLLIGVSLIWLPSFI